MSLSRIPVRILVEGLGESRGVLIRFLSPRTVDAIVRLLPMEGRAAIWRSQISIEVPIKLGVEKPRETVKRGDLAYWPFGRAFCIFLKDMRPYSPVNLIGQLTENIEVFSGAKSGTKIRVERIEAGT